MTWRFHSGILALSLVAALAGAEPEPDILPENSIYRIDATWTTDAGGTFDLAQLRGHPVVLAMFFTRCQSACPLVVAAMIRIQAALPAAVRRQTQFLLVSFDSRRDDAASLLAYRHLLRLPLETWSLVRGDPDDVRQLAMVLGTSYQAAQNGQIAHAAAITVLNGGGEIVHQQTGLTDEEQSVSVETINRAAH